MVPTSATQVVLLGKNLPASAGDGRDASLIPGSGRSPGGGRGNPLQYSCLETPLDRGAEWTRVQTVTESRTRLKRLSIRASSRELSQPMCAQSGLVTHCHSQSPVFPACFTDLRCLCARHCSKHFICNCPISNLLQGCEKPTFTILIL